MLLFNVSLQTYICNIHIVLKVGSEYIHDYFLVEMTINYDQGCHGNYLFIYLL